MADYETLVNDGIKCNMCGKDFEVWDAQEDFSIHKQFGYGTIYDGDHLNLHLCCECIEKVIDMCKISPVVCGDTGVE